MTSHKDQIQALIDEIDGVLSKPSPRLPWVMAGDADQQRQVLEQTRGYLVSLQQQIDTDRLGPAGAQPYGSPYTQDQAAAESAQQVLQAVLQEMNYLRSNVMQPLRHDVDDLQQQREALTQEIRALEAQRQQYLLPQQQVNQQQIITEFLQSLMVRLQENLTGQVAQMLTNLETQTLQERSLIGGTNTAGAALPEGTSSQPALSPQERLEQVQMLQAQSDQLLLKLDSTLGVIFESLQSNIQSYQDSLSQGLDKMHNLGQQGEAMFSALVNRLAQQLGREASTYLQSSLQSPDWATGTPPLPASSAQTPANPRFSLGGADSSAQTDNADAEIDLLLSELNADGPGTVLQPPTTSIQPPISTAASEQGDLTNPFATLNLEGVELADLDLGQPQGSLISDSDYSDDIEDDITIFQVNQPLTTFQFNDNPQLQSDLEAATQTGDLNLSDDPEVVDLDSALELLNQLSAELQSDDELSDVESDLISTPTSEEVSTEAGDEGEIDELYQSLFGVDADIQSSPDDDTADLTEPVDQHIADANQPANEFPELSYDDSNFADLNEEATPEMLVEELFAGLSDPAEAEFDDLSSEASDQSTDVLEELIGESLESSPEMSNEALLLGLQDESQTDLTNTATSSGGIDAIASLSDLIGAPETDIPSELTESLYTETGSEAAEDADAFVPAAPDEVLLVDEEPAAEAPNDIRLDADTLNQLTADLSSLEGLDENFFSSPPVSDSAVDTDWTLEPLDESESLMSEETPFFSDSASTDAEPPTDRFASATEADEILAEDELAEDDTVQPADEDSLFSEFEAAIASDPSDSASDPSDSAYEETAYEETDSTDTLDESALLTAEDDLLDLDSLLESENSIPDLDSLLESENSIPDLDSLLESEGSISDLDSLLGDGDSLELSDTPLDIELLPETDAAEMLEERPDFSALDTILTEIPNHEISQLRTPAAQPPLEAAALEDSHEEAVISTPAEPVETIETAETAEPVETVEPASAAKSTPSDISTLEDLFSSNEDLFPSEESLSDLSDDDSITSFFPNASNDENLGMTLDQLGDTLSALTASEQSTLDTEDSFAENLFSEIEADNSLPDDNTTESDGMTLAEFGESVGDASIPTSLNVISDAIPNSAALHANDTALPPPSIPLEEDATIEGFFAAAPPVTPASVDDSVEESFSGFFNTEPADPGMATLDSETNAFTLEGLDSLFEDVPSTERSLTAPEQPAQTEPQSWTLQDPSVNLGQAPPPPPNDGTENDGTDTNLASDPESAAPEDFVKKKL